MSNGACKVYVMPCQSYHNCPKVVKTRNRPSVELACNVAPDPSAGMVSEYPSTRDSTSSKVSDVILLVAVWDVNLSVSDGSHFALWMALADDAPRSITRA